LLCVLIQLCRPRAGCQTAG